ncbi:hypothetical protein [Pararhizobium qamdonense]|uniref:hypothetical protein n=1 Tax=Pararhizobium qamdonense TaxID=3031126 RepID=UPI0023E165D3|nr:hypothetical protein [Pararhizobium qamdonense]
MALNFDAGIIGQLIKKEHDWLSQIQPMMNRYADERLVTYQMPARRHGKSQAPPVTRSTLAGTKPTIAILDEMSRVMNSTKLSIDEFSRVLAPISVLGPELVYKDSKWPGSRVEVWLVEVDKRDPRNPNPQAGKTARYEVRGERAVVETFRSLEEADRRAQGLHQIAVRQVQQEMRQANPNFGRF